MRLLTIHGPDDVRLDEVKEPSPGADDVVLKVAACGICGSDLSFIRHGGSGAQGMARPMPLGHEAAGIVHAVGRNVKDIAPGMRVILNPMIADSVIGNGGPEGAFTDRLLVRGATLGRTLYDMPDNMDFEVGALAEPLIPRLCDQNPCAQSRNPMDMMVQG